MVVDGTEGDALIGEETFLFGVPCPQASTILARSATEFAVLAPPSPANQLVSASLAFGRPAGHDPRAVQPGNRERHFRIVSVVSPSYTATPVSSAAGSAHASTIRARSASRGNRSCGKRASWMRSSSVSTHRQQDSMLPAAIVQRHNPAR